MQRRVLGYDAGLSMVNVLVAAVALAAGTLLALAEPLVEGMAAQLAPLKGVDGIVVDAVVVGPSDAPVSEGEVRQLMAARLGVLGGGFVRAEGPTARPTLVASVLMAPTEACVFRVRLRLSEAAMVVGGDERGRVRERLRADTWFSPVCYSNASLDARACANRMRECVDGLVARFVDDLRKANSF